MTSLTPEQLAEVISLFEAGLTPPFVVKKTGYPLADVIEAWLVWTGEN